MSHPRYSDFEEIKCLGRGSFGIVTLCKHKGMEYAVKKIPIDRFLPLNDRQIREVAALLKSQHEHVVKYYDSWYENEEDEEFLYIQMEYYPRTLEKLFGTHDLNTEFTWNLFYQIVKALAHIHAQGIMHCDLTPFNIFLDVQNNIKIGDFGLAQFLNLEHEIETAGLSIGGIESLGTPYYTAPEIKERWGNIDEKADTYSLGVVFFELWHPFGTSSEREYYLRALKKGKLPDRLVTEFPEQAALLRRMISQSRQDRPTATELLYEKWGTSGNIAMLRMKDSHDSDELSILSKTPKHDLVVDKVRKVYKQHGGVFVVSFTNGTLLNAEQVHRDLDAIYEYRQELRYHFAKQTISGHYQRPNFRGYNIHVYRRAIDHSPPNRYLQGDFDIVGGETALTEAMIIKVSMDVVSQFFNSESCDIHLNHGDIMRAIWSWTGIKPDNRKKVAELLSLLGSLPPQSSERKFKWVVIRRLLKQELDLSDRALDRLQIVGLDCCATAKHALPRLRRHLRRYKYIHEAFDEVKELFKGLSAQKIERHVFFDALMPPTKDYHRNLYFQIYLKKDCYPEGILLASGGRYDYLIQKMANFKNISNLSHAVGASIELNTVLLHWAGEESCLV